VGDKGPAVDKPEDRFVLGPVGWLLGPELIGQLGKILRRRSSPRDWMPYYRGAVHDECWQRNGRLVRVGPTDSTVEAGVLNREVDRGTAPVATSKDVVDPRPLDAPAADDECWFDYLADAGDAGDSMYAIAYTTMISFVCDVPEADRVTWTAGHATVELTPHLVADACPPNVLPVGQFVFVGGDTAYHVADAATLKARVQTPFEWAFADAKQHGHVSANANPDVRSRRLYGIPGNHDWYDNLDGFSKVFRLGTLPGTDPVEAGPIELPQLQRVQLGSYAAIQLPQGWQLWGLDIDSPLDVRQREYFRSVGVPNRLVLATPSPAIVFGACYPKPEHAEALKTLGLGLLPDPLPATRLDLSGDVHHYARYYPRSDGGPSGYGSVVSGLGGAFHHPGFTRLTGVASERCVEPVRMYPTEDESRDSIADGLLTARATWFGSWMRLVPMLVALVLGFAATHSVGGRWLLDQLFGVLPGCAPTPRAGGATVLGHAACALGVLVLAIVLIVWAIRLGGGIYRSHVDTPERARNVIDLFGNRKLDRLHMIRALLDPRRSYWLPWLIGLAALATFGLYPLWGPDPGASTLDVATLVLVVGFPAGLAVVAWVFGADGLRFRQRLAIGAAGFLQGTAHVLTPLLLTRMFVVLSWRIAAVVALVVVVAVVLSPRLARPVFRSRCRGAPLAVAALALAVVIAALGTVLLVIHAHPFESQREPWWLETWRLLLAGGAAMPLGTIWFTWYLAVCARLNGHNNEVGGTARVTKYRQLIRFHVHAGGLTGYVIAVQNKDKREAARCDHNNLEFHLIDIFTIPVDGPSQANAPVQLLGAIEMGGLNAVANEE
jgi:hypothetical protein